ncbi:MAG: phosphorylase [Elusimicrobiota bacterium]
MSDAFAPGTLRRLVLGRTVSALQSGALRPIPTGSELVAQDGVEFVVRIFTNLARKETHRKGRDNKNPFLPPEQDLTVAGVSAAHFCILNKFNVFAHHLLIVTREFEEQERLLTAADCAALLRCMAEYEALGFYNGGETAGASERHKHLQLVPLPLTTRGPSVPIEAALAGAEFRHGIGMSVRLPFRHALAAVEPRWSADRMLEAYHGLLNAVGVDGAAPYNLLMTRRWMLAVPRAAEKFGSVSINALGFAGSLLVRNAAELAKLKELGPMNVLKSVGCPR